MKLWGLPQIQNLQSADDLKRFATQMLTNFYQILNKNVGFEDNMNVQLIRGKDILPVLTDVKVSHKLGVIPIGYIIVRQSAFAIIREGEAAWTTDAIYLQTDTVTTVDIIIIGS